MTRLTRDFSGRVPTVAGYATKARAPAFARQVMARRENGEYIGLLLLAVDAWDAGWMFADREHVVRVVCAADFDISAADLSVVAGLDVLVCGAADAERFDLAVLGAMRAGAASVWGMFDALICRVEFWPYGPPYYVAATVPVPTGLFPRALVGQREAAIVLGEGLYAAPDYRPARAAILARCGLTPEGTLMAVWPPAPDAEEVWRDAVAETTHRANSRMVSKEAYAEAQASEAQAYAALLAARQEVSDRVDGRDAASPRRVPSHDGLGHTR